MEQLLFSVRVVLFLPAVGLATQRKEPFHMKILPQKLKAFT